MAFASEDAACIWRAYSLIKEAGDLLGPDADRDILSSIRRTLDALETRHDIHGRPDPVKVRPDYMRAVPTE